MKKYLSNLLHFMWFFSPQFKCKFISDFQQNMVCIQEISYRLLYCDVKEEFPIVFPAKTPENSFCFVSVLL